MTIPPKRLATFAIFLMVLCSWVAVPIAAGGVDSSTAPATMPCDGADPGHHDHSRDCSDLCNSGPDQDSGTDALAGASRSPTPGKLSMATTSMELAQPAPEAFAASLPRAPPLLATATPVARHDILLD